MDVLAHRTCLVIGVGTCGTRVGVVIDYPPAPRPSNRLIVFATTSVANGAVGVLLLPQRLKPYRDTAVQCDVP
eukprot:4421641-Prymnesium_polylepis.1